MQPTILDSGDRRTFDSGAVRDISEGKGRCDLLPLDVVALLVKEEDVEYDGVLLNINTYVRKGNPINLLFAIKEFCSLKNLDMCTAMLEVSKHYEAGANKYAERNWEKGISLHCYVDSGVRHYLKCVRGDIDEPHDRAFIWNMLGAYWTHTHKPEQIDLPFNISNGGKDNEAD